MNAPQSTLPVAKLPLRQVANVRELLVNEQAQQQLSAVAAGHMKPERMMRLMANAMRTTPKLGQCSPMSLLGAMMQCAGLGLEPNTVLGHAYLIPFDRKEKNKQSGRWEVVETNVQLIIGYKGYIDLARRSGHITSISAGVHYSDDETSGGIWEYEEGTEAKLRHSPGELLGTKKHAYAIARFRDGGHAYVVLPWSKVMKIRDGSQGWQSALRSAQQYGKSEINSPWFTHEDEMAQKTAVRALAKFLPLSTEFRDGLEADSGRADYAAFALAPTAGLDVIPDDDGFGDQIDHDPEAGEVQQVEDQRATQQTIEPEREKVAAAPRRKTNTRTDSTPYAEGGPKAKDGQQAALDMGQPDKADDEIAALVKEVTEKMQGDIYDGAKLEETIELYEAKLERIRAASPDQHKALIASLENYVASLD